MGAVTVRPMRAEEARDVRKMGRRAFAGLESLWVSKPGQALVAVREDKIVGAVLYKLMNAGGKNIAYVDYAFVDPDYHNQGLGGSLYRAATEFLWALGPDALTAIVKDDNVGSWSLFLKNGFSRVSLPQLAGQFGFWGSVKQYFATPFCFGVGMEYYVALRGRECPSGKTGGVRQMLAFVLANALLFPIALLGGTGSAGTLFAAYLLMLFAWVAGDFVGSRFSGRGWRFRFNNGGGLVCALANLGALYPMIGAWYPERYEKTAGFRRDMGITALGGWLAILGITAFSVLGGADRAFVRLLGQIGAMFLIYRMLPFYPFESFGGRRVYDWNRWVFGGMALISLAVVAAVNLP